MTIPNILQEELLLGVSWFDLSLNVVKSAGSDSPVSILIPQMWARVT